MSYRGDIGVAVAVAINKHLDIVASIAIKSRVHVPYIPGLLAFREAPIMITAIKKLLEKVNRVDVVMVNGHGLAHPRLAGIATHIGLALDIPSIGIAQKKLFGEVRGEGNLRELYVYNMKVGYVIKFDKREVYVTIGNRCNADTALAIAKKFWLSGRPLPEPIYQADRLSRMIVKHHLR